MKFEKIYLREGNEAVTLDCFLHTVYPELPSLSVRPAVIVCPGGGYLICSAREADPVAMAYTAAGYHTFVLRYTVGEAAAYPNSLIDLCQAVKLIRDRAEEWGVNPDQIAVCGFSAGGHLAASLGVHWNEEKIQKAAGVTGEEIKPNALVLIYPVISTSWAENNGQLERLIGDGDFEETYKALNLHTCVKDSTPPTFLAHTFRDLAVPVTDSINFAAALDKERIPFELHIWPNGGHGMSLADPHLNGTGDDPSFSDWNGLSIKWLNRLFRNPEEAATPVSGSIYSSKL